MARFPTSFLVLPNFHLTHVPLAFHKHGACFLLPNYLKLVFYFLAYVNIKEPANLDLLI